VTKIVTVYHNAASWITNDTNIVGSEAGFDWCPEFSVAISTACAPLNVEKNIQI
jgi:hypothetical protein